MEGTSNGVLEHHHIEWGLVCGTEGHRPDDTVLFDPK